MKVLSLFSGIGAFEKALDRLKVPYQLINYCEIDKYASKAYAMIHECDESLNLGDITKIDTSTLPNDIDLITYGFPCQYISLAGKQKGFEADGERTRSGLFFEALRIIEDKKPRIAIAENVKNLTSKKFKKEFNIVLTSLEQAGYNIYWKVMNAKDYGIPQNRERVFIVSIRKDVDNGLFKFPKLFELKLRLKDMLEDEVDEKYYLSQEKVSNFLKMGNVNPSGKGMGGNVNTKDISDTLTTNKGEGPKILEPVRKYGIFDDEKGKHQAGSVWDKEGLAPTLDTMQGGYRQPCIEEPQVLNPLKGKTDNGWHFEQQIYDENGITRAVKAGGGSGNIPKVIIGSTQKNAAKNYEGVCPTLTSAMGSGGGHVPMHNYGLRIRKLTPLECWRLMGFSDEDFYKVKGISNS